MGKAEAEELKLFITRQEECFTPNTADARFGNPGSARLGTTNWAAYLRDETGARRFLAGKVGTDRHRQVGTRSRPLFAEAVHLFSRGSQWSPDAAFEAEHIRPQQAAQDEDDAWQHAIADWPIAAQRHVTILQVARDALHIETANSVRPISGDRGGTGFGLGGAGVRESINGVEHWEQIPWNADPQKVATCRRAKSKGYGSGSAR